MCFNLASNLQWGQGVCVYPDGQSLRSVTDLELGSETLFQHLLAV